MTAPTSPTDDTFPRLRLGAPALVLAPMQGLTDAPMRAVQGEIGAFTFGVSEFVRVSATVAPRSVFRRYAPELKNRGARTASGLPVQVQLLGGDASRMAESARVAVEAGALALDINFGCPAPTVNNHDGGASLLKYPHRIREIVAAVRDAVPASIPVSAKLRLGWDDEDAILENAERAAEGGADWITIHGRTRNQGYRPPAYWKNIGVVRARLNIPVVANGDIWNLDDFRRCRDETGADHFMLGRSAMSNPRLSRQIAHELGLVAPGDPNAASPVFDWRPPLHRLVCYSQSADLFPNIVQVSASRYLVARLKQWLNLARLHGDFRAFDALKRVETVDEIFAVLTRDFEERAQVAEGK